MHVLLQSGNLMLAMVDMRSGPTIFSVLVFVSPMGFPEAEGGLQGKMHCSSYQDPRSGKVELCSPGSSKMTRK